jgi:hypothetical protein
MIQRITLIFLFCAASISLAALDYGVVINQEGTLSTPDVESDLPGGYVGHFMPWFSWAEGEDIDFYASAGALFMFDRYWLDDEDKEWGWTPDVGRTGLVWRPSESVSFEAGRFRYTDPLGFVMNGLFDGFSLVWNEGGGRFRLGTYGSGFLYKKTSYIIMSNDDLARFHDGSWYFASRRVMLTADWELLSARNAQNQINIGGISQWDANDRASDRIHTQYLTFRWRRPLGSGWYMDLGGAVDFELRERALGIGFALSAAPFWIPPSYPNGRLFFLGRFASGNWGDSIIRSFKPVTTEAQGRVLRTRFTGLSWIEGGYAYRFLPRLEGEFSAAYFFRTDNETFVDRRLTANGEAFVLGGEVYGSVKWVPFSFCELSIGGGYFFPLRDEVYAYNAATQWRFVTAATVSF